MSYLEYSVRRVPSGPAKILHLNWALIVLILAVCGFGVVMLYSVAGGRFDVWADAQLTRIGAGFVVMIAFAMVPIWFWRNVAGLAYGVALVLLGLSVLSVAYPTWNPWTPPWIWQWMSHAGWLPPS